MKFRKLCFISLSALLIFTWGCNAANGAPVSSGTGSAVKNSSSDSVSSLDSSSVSSNASKSAVTADSSSNSTTASSTSEEKGLLFAEDDHTKAIFHIGMTSEQVKKALAENQMQTVENRDPSPNRISTDHGIDLLFTLGTDLFDKISIESDSDTQLHSSYKTQKGLKIGDAVETVRKLYGEPVEQAKYGDNLNGQGVAYYYDIPINLDNYYKVQTVKNKSDRGVYLRINISQSKGNNYNKVVTIIYAEKANN
ncbi:hypothetical protein CAFE_15650 [Caprobacter fermentans]|uniref:Lipoprotein n=1 Tax=Caproicibacter fermentans TaxID=2576756 RepID=A0A6N8HZF7_9FIRM|nr:hypothetical protein [Caproicibacter fermentans]MVB10867.1 hypothetical protein [Caproicibacter fermentans]